MKTAFSTRCLLIVATIALAIPHSSFAGKGGNGKGNGGGGGGGGGGGDPSGPVEVEAPVTYRVTWFDPEEPLGLSGPPQLVKLVDVNSLGEAVGLVRRPDGFWIGVLASVAIDGSSNGMIYDLNEVFADELAQNHPGWRFHSGYQINPAGNIAGKLLPEDHPTADGSPLEKVVVADLATGAIHDLGTFDQIGVFGIEMNENGDVKVSGQLEEGSDRSHWLYLRTSLQNEEISYTEISLQKIDALQTSDRQINSVAMNSSLTFSFTAYSSETRSRDPFVYHFDPDPSLDGVPINLTDGRKRRNDSAYDIAEDGTIYGKLDGAAARWREASGWEPFLVGGRVSRDPDDPSFRSGGDAIHKDSLGGFFKVLVTEGDAVRYHAALSDPEQPLSHESISRRATVSDSSVAPDHGFICGWLPFIDGVGATAGFILSPIASTPGLHSEE